VAELVLELGGSLSLYCSGVPLGKAFQQGDELPQTRFVIRSIFLYQSPALSDDHLKTIGECQYLEQLVISATNISDQGVQSLSSLPNLQYLDLSHTRINGTCLKSLANLPSLVSLSLAGSPIRPEQVATVSQIKTLRAFRMSGVPVDDDTIALLQNCQSLNVLQLQEALVTEKGLASLMTLPSLQELQLTRTAISDRDVEILARFPALARVDLRETNITEEGAIQLAENLPNCCVFTNFPESMKSERSLAEQLLEQGANIVLLKNPVATVSVTSEDELPEVPFAVRSVVFPEGRSQRLNEFDWSGLKTIQELIWPNCTEADMLLEHLAKCPTLVSLHLPGSDLSVVGAEKIAKLPQLEQLFLSGAKGVDNSCLKAIGLMDHLYLLSLEGCSLSGSGLEHLANLKSLRFLNVYRCPLDFPSHIASLAAIPGPLVLCMGQCGLDDSAVPHLKQLTNCSILFVDGNEISDEAARQLQAALPNCVVFHEALADE